jgi:hypothetical protein
MGKRNRMIDIEKYKTLADNTYQLIDLLMLKIVQQANDNGHNMSICSQSFEHSRGFILFSTQCNKCDYEVWVCNNGHEGLTMKCEDMKCTREYK